MKHKKKPFAFTQDFGTYNHEMPVFVGMTKAEATKWCKSKKFVPKFMAFLEDCPEFIDDRKGLKQLGCLYLGSGYYALWLSPYEDTWAYWEVLIHELTHFIDEFSKDKHMEGETEARAYLLEFMFRSIRRKLQGLDPK